MKKKWWIFGLALAIAVAFLSPLASSSPDGLERVAEDKAFMDKAQDTPYEIIPGYVFPGVSNEAVATIVAGVVGTLIVVGLCYGTAYVLRRRDNEQSAMTNDRFADS